MTDDPNAIRENIAETRERLSSTIEEIGERLNPQTLTENVKDSIRDATIGRVRSMARSAADSVGRTTSGVAHTIRENPIPAALVAVGIGWMIWNARASNGESRSSGVRALRDDADGELEREVAHDIGYGDEYGAAYAGGYGQAYGQQPGAAQRVKQAAARAGGSVKEKAEDAFDENPLMVGAVALAAGLAAGLAVPVTDREVSLIEGSTPGLAEPFTQGSPQG